MLAKLLIQMMIQIQINTLMVMLTKNFHQEKFKLQCLKKLQAKISLLKPKKQRRSPWHLSKKLNQAQKTLKSKQLLMKRIKRFLMEQWLIHSMIEHLGVSLVLLQPMHVDHFVNLLIIFPLKLLWIYVCKCLVEVHLISDQAKLRMIVNQRCA